MESPLQEDISKINELTSTRHDCNTSKYLSLGDIVRSKDCGKIGIVTKTVANELDWYDSYLDSPDHVEVQWDNDAVRECVNRNDVTLVSKYLCFGDHVASALNPSGQCGFVVDINILVDLLTPDGSIIEGVDTKELIHATDIYHGSWVRLGSWIGKINSIINNVTVSFDNGLSCEFTEANETSLKPIDYLTKIDLTRINFPGQRVKAHLKSVCYRSPRFLLGLWKPQSLEGTVTKVSVKSVCVDWVSYVEADGFSTEKPDEKQSPEILEFYPFTGQSCWIWIESCRLKNVEGILKIVNVKAKIDVTWQDGSTKKGLDSTTLIQKHNTTFRFFPQQFVRMKNTQESNDGCEIGFIESVDPKEKTAVVRWQRGGVYEEENRKVSIYELERHPEHGYFYGNFVGHNTNRNRDLSDHPPRIGIVTGMENGLINVSWMNETDSKVVPEDILLFYRDVDYDDDVYNLESKESRTFVGKLLVLLFYYGIRMLSLRLWDIKQFIRFQSKSFGQEESKVYLTSKGFEVVEDLSDHFFRVQGQSNASRKWLKKVQHDWRILQNDLPDGIIVRVYEERMDLLRAMIVGPYGTPYQDALFFFDFFLPPGYPDVPPVVHYHSGGWRVNPNLYEDGKVCLSLLNTWHGKGNEVWDTSSSTILQVLVSIQGLILNSKPYFNEAGYESLIGSVEGENDSLCYNEGAYLLSCKSMMHVMRHPLKGFEELVNEHFSNRGYYILKACDAYNKGYQIGCLKKDASPSKISLTVANSVGFKLTLATKIAPKLFLALNEVGADCHDFKHLLQLYE